MMRTIWDWFFIEGDIVLFKTAIFFLETCEKELLKTEDFRNFYSLASFIFGKQPRPWE
jgi:hypothetical protein